jgi:hypothetical protein
VDIDWLAFIIVFGAAIVSASVVVSLYSLGIRFLAMPAPPAPKADGTLEPTGPSRDDEDDDIEAGVRPRWASFGAGVCFSLSIVTVIIGIILIVPALHIW